MQTLHEPLHRKFNRINVLKVWASSEAKTLKDVVLHALEDPEKRRRVTEIMNMPTFVAFRMLDCAGLPKAGDLVFSSTATANSCNDDAVTSALHILGMTDPDFNINFQRSSTATLCGITAVSNMPPKNPAVTFDPSAIFTEWTEVARSLARQFYRMTRPEYNDSDVISVFPHYDKMYHYGCISQNWTTNSLGTHVSNWGLHKHWNILMTSAMLHHIAVTLKAGGDAILKVRVFRRSETLGLTALLSALFERMEIVDVPDNMCTYVGAVYFGMTRDEELRKQVAETIWKAMDQNVCNIFCNTIMLRDDVKQNLTKCVEHRQSMMDLRARSNTLFLTCVRHLCNQIQQRKHPETFPCSELVELFGQKRGNYFKHRWTEAHWKLTDREMNDLVELMNKPWMREVC